MVSGKKRRKLLAKARRAPNSLRFSEICRLAEYFGWELKRQSGTSHSIYRNTRLAGSNGELMNFQNREGKAKPYQVRQLIDAIDEFAERGEDD